MAKSNSDSVGEQRHERRRELLRRWRASGLSQAAFCRHRKIPAWKFRWWRNRLKGAAGASGELFLPLRVAPTASSAGDLELAMRGGLVLRFGADVDPAALAGIVKALSLAPGALDGEGRSC